MIKTHKPESSVDERGVPREPARERGEPAREPARERGDAARESARERGELAREDPA